MGPGPFPGIVLIHHLPGWCEWCREAMRRFAHHGYAAISHNLYHRTGGGVYRTMDGGAGVPDSFKYICNLM